MISVLRTDSFSQTSIKIYDLMIFYVFIFQIWMIHPFEIICGNIQGIDKVKISDD